MMKLNKTEPLRLNINIAHKVIELLYSYVQQRKLGILYICKHGNFINSARLKLWFSWEIAVANNLPPHQSFRGHLILIVSETNQARIGMFYCELNRFLYKI